MKRLFLVWILIFSFISVPGLALIHDVAHPFHAHLHHHHQPSHELHTASHAAEPSQQIDDKSPHNTSGFHYALETWLCELYDLTSAQFIAKCHNPAPQVVHLVSAINLPTWVQVYSPRFYPSFWSRAPPVTLI